MFLGLQRASWGAEGSRSGGNATSRLFQCFCLFWLPILDGVFIAYDRCELVYSTLGRRIYGAGYAADHVTRIALWIMVGVSALACVLLALNFFRPRLPLASDDQVC